MEEATHNTSNMPLLFEKEVVMLETVQSSILDATSEQILSVVLNRSGPEKPVLVVMALHTDPFLHDQPALRMNCTVRNEEEIVAEVFTYNRESVSRVVLGPEDDVSELILPLLKSIGRQEVRACTGVVSSDGNSDDLTILASVRKSDVPNVLLEKINERVVLRSRSCAYYIDSSRVSDYNSCEKCLGLCDELQTRLGLKKNSGLAADLATCKLEPSESVQETSSTEAEKKRRGRPKGSKNKFYFGKDFVSPDEALNETLKDSADTEVQGNDESFDESMKLDESTVNVDDPKDADYVKASDRRLSRRLAGRKRSSAILELLKRRRGRPPNITDPVECSDCGQSFTVVRDFKQHLLEHTNSFVCSFEDCTKRFKTVKDQEIHMRKHRGEKPYLCNECDKAFSTRQDLKLHSRKHTGGRPFKCGQCPKSFARAQQLKIHAVVHTGEREYLCGECGHAYGSLSTLIDHRKRKHLHLREHKCHVCSKGFFTRQELEAHSRTHTGDKPFLCNLCGKSFSRTHHLKRHVEGVHRGGQGKTTTTALVMSDGSILKFDDDDTVYVTTMAAESEGGEEALLRDGRAVLVSELVTETTEGVEGEEVQLVQEDAAVLDSAAVVQLAEGQGGYILIHTGDEEAKLLPLSQYSQAFLFLAGEKPHCCSECPRRFSRRSALRIHRTSVHETVKAFLCPECGTAFKANSALIDHRKRVHLQVKPHICLTCGKDFFSRKDYAEHVRTHTGERPFLCNLCGKNFGRQNHLKRHVAAVHRGGMLVGRKTAQLSEPDRPQQSASVNLPTPIASRQTNSQAFVMEPALSAPTYFGVHSSDEIFIITERDAQV